MQLTKHKSPVPAELSVLKGTIKYIQDGQKEMIEEMEVKNIPPHTDHEAEAITDSYCLLIQQKKP
jgi:quercetin dioxygenase-like cupin family protein